MSDQKTQSQVNAEVEQTQERPFRFEVRPELDGLRAIAVLFVLISHTPSGLFKYGFIGVPIFFVLSGYLITGVILRDLTKRKFTILGFYERRIKRIIPNLVLCCFVNFSLAYYYNLYDMKQISMAGLQSLLMVKNYQFLLHSSVKAFYENHFWSISSQQQYYIIWPFVVPFLLRQSFKKQIIILLLISVSSFLSMIVFPKGGILGTAWNLMLGCIITVVQYDAQKRQAKKIIINQPDSFSIGKNQENTPIAMDKKNQQNPMNKIVVNIITTLVLITVFLMSLFGFDWLPFLKLQGVAFSRWFGGISGLLAFILVYTRDTYVSYLLSFRLLRFIGRQSYCIYVWHFPYLVVMDKIGKDWLRPCYFAIAVTCCFFEDKITNSKSKRTVYWVILSYLIVVAIMAVAYLAN